MRNWDKGQQNGRSRAILNAAASPCAHGIWRAQTQECDAMQQGRKIEESLGRQRLLAVPASTRGSLPGSPTAWALVRSMYDGIWCLRLAGSARSRPVSYTEMVERGAKICRATTAPVVCGRARWKFDKRWPEA